MDSRSTGSEVLKTLLSKEKNKVYLDSSLKTVRHINLRDSGGMIYWR